MEGEEESEIKVEKERRQEGAMRKVKRVAEKLEKCDEGEGSLSVWYVRRVRAMVALLKRRNYSHAHNRSPNFY